MKSYRLIIAAFLLMGLFSFVTVSAQDDRDREDVVYLKNGNIYRGIIIEQVPGQTIKIETIGGNVFTVAISDITKTTREKKAMSLSGPSGDMYHDHGHDGNMYHGEGHWDDRRMDRDRYHHDWDSSGHRRMGYHYQKRGYFFQGQLLAEAVEGGGRIVNGYKFGQFGYLGIGIGIDVLMKDARMNTNNSGVYLPLYIHYSGDILKKRITPFYSVEAGYAMLRNNRNNNNNFGGSGFPEGDPNAINSHGGMMGGVGFGAKFHLRHGRCFFTISGHLDFQQASNEYNQVLYNPGGGYTLSNYWVKTTVPIPGFRFGVGF